MSLNLYTLCVIYLVYSFLGWVGETVVATAKGRRFTNRGVASGPFCFVYGTAGVLITIGLNDQRASLAALFFGSMIYATVVEWLTAKLLERIHHRRWWDYSDKKFNLDGYVCLQYSLLWGLLGMAAVRWGNDLLFRLCAQSRSQTEGHHKHCRKGRNQTLHINSPPIIRRTAATPRPASTASRSSFFRSRGRIPATLPVCPFME